MLITCDCSGSGKTTLVQNILKNTVGLRILVIENEIGEEGIDHELLLQNPKEDIVLMNNGCICCTGSSKCSYVPPFTITNNILIDFFHVICANNLI